jgi:hypothetical protein
MRQLCGLIIIMMAAPCSWGLVNYVYISPGCVYQLIENNNEFTGALDDALL